MSKYSSEINRWVSLCRMSQKEREEKQPQWDDIDKYFRGMQWKEIKNDNYDIVIVNMVYSHVKVIIPGVYYRNPKIYFEPNSPASVDRAKLMEAIFNYDMQKMRLKVTNKRILQDVILYGTGFSKTTYELITPPPQEPGDAEIVDNLLSEFNNVSGNVTPESKLSIPKSGPRIIRVSPRDIAFAVGATDIEDPGFIAHHVRKRLISVKNDSYYKNTSDLQPTHTVTQSIRAVGGAYTGYESDEYLDCVDLWEIWDVEKNQYFTIAEGHDEYLRSPDENPYPYNHPFDKLVYTHLEDQMWGLSEIEPWMVQQDELNKVRTQQHNHIKRYNRKYIADQDSFEGEEQINKAESGEDGTVIMTQGQRPLSERIAALQDAPMPADVFRVSAQIEDDIVKVGGITPYRRGGIVGANTATEANIAESNSQTRDSDRIDSNGEFVLRQMEKVRMLRKEFTIGDEMIDVTGNPLDLDRWKYIKRQEIDLDMEMRVEYNNAPLISQQQRKTDAVMLYDRAMANPTVNPQAAFVNLLEAFDKRDYTQWFMPNAYVQMHLMMKLMGAAKEQNKGISPTGPTGAGEPGPAISTETPAELSGRAAPIA